MDERRARLDAQPIEHGEQQQRFGLAVAIAQRPGRFRRLRHVIAVFHTPIEVADFVLHDAQGSVRAGLGIGGRRGDPVDLGR